MKMSVLKDDAARLGWIPAVLSRVMLRLEQFFGLEIFRVNTRALKAQREPAALPDITIRKVTAEELLEAANDPALELDPRFVGEALARGDLAWGAFEQGKLICYTWRATAKAPFTDGVWVRVPSTLQYGYKSYTRPSHRGRGLYPAVGRVADEQSRELGHPAMLHLVNVANVASHRSASQLGSRKVGYAGYFKFFGRRPTFRTPSARALGVELYLPRSAPPPAHTQRAGWRADAGRP